MGVARATLPLADLNFISWGFRILLPNALPFPSPLPLEIQIGLFELLKLVFSSLLTWYANLEIYSQQNPNF